MDATPPNIDELLSGMLDGVLSEGEIRQLEGAMKVDPTIQVRLDELALLRTALLHGRTKGRLSPNFARSVTEQARKRAVEMGQEAPSWLLEDELDKINDAPLSVSQSTYFRPVVYSLVLGAAAVFAFVLFIWQGEQRQGLITNVPGIEELIKPSEKDSARDLLANELSPELDPNAVPKPNVPESVTPESSRIVEIQPKTESSERPEANSVLPRNQPIPSIEKPSFADSKPTIEQGTRNSVSPRLDAVMPAIPFFTLVLEISVDPIARENKALEGVFDRYGIAYADDLAISPEQLTALEDSKLIATDNAGEKIGVLFVRSAGLKLNQALTDIIAQTKDFPDVGLNMSADRSAALLVKQLGNVAVSNGSADFARSLTADRTFTAGANRKTISARDISLKSPATAILLQEQKQAVNALILIRAAK
ncbi:MAG: hypothetical protein ABL921_00900 [Pirellula sp.]